MFMFIFIGLNYWKKSLALKLIILTFSIVIVIHERLKFLLLFKKVLYEINAIQKILSVFSMNWFAFSLIIYSIKLLFLENFFELLVDFML
jgi:hypothetical protein